jgi:hypothetical protein
MIVKRVVDLTPGRIVERLGEIDAKDLGADRR